MAGYWQECDARQDTSVRELVVSGACGVEGVLGVEGVIAVKGVMGVEGVIGAGELRVSSVHISSAPFMFHVKSVVGARTVQRNER